MKEKNYLIFAIIAIFVFAGIIVVLSNILNAEWVEISIFGQCYPEPWKNDDNIKSFFQGYDISVHDINIRSRGFVCEACGCPSYKIKEILIDSVNKRRVLKILNRYKGL